MKRWSSPSQPRAISMPRSYAGVQLVVVGREGGVGDSEGHGGQRSSEGPAGRGAAGRVRAGRARAGGSVRPTLRPRRARPGSPRRRRRRVRAAMPKPAGDRGEVRRGELGAEVVVRVVAVAQHPVAAVVDDDRGEREPLLRGGRELADARRASRRRRSPRRPAGRRPERGRGADRGRERVAERAPAHRVVERRAACAPGSGRRASSPGCTCRRTRRRRRGARPRCARGTRSTPRSRAWCAARRAASSTSASRSPAHGSRGVDRVGEHAR